MSKKTTLGRFGHCLNHVADYLSILCVVLIPILLGVIFFMLISMNGAPRWYLVLHGVLFLASLVALFRFLAAGLIQALLNSMPKGTGR